MPSPSSFSPSGRFFAIESLESRTLLASPEVIGAEHEWRHAPNTLSFQFDSDVSASLSTTDLSAHNLSSDAHFLATGWSWDSGTKTATFTLPA
jgi:hypothetical protein